MKKHRFTNASVMERKFLSDEIHLIVGEVVYSFGSPRRAGRYWEFSDGVKVHCKYVEKDRVAVIMSYRDAGLPAERFGQMRGWDNRRYAEGLYMPHTFVVEGVRCVRVDDLTEEDILKAGVYVNRGGNYMVGGSVGGWERTASAAFRRMIKVPAGENPWVIVYDITPVISR